ncbi:MAG TPA: YezD family protein [Symbiobacteriaceae bacterium]
MPEAPKQPFPDVTPDEERVLRATLASLRQIRHGHVQLVLHEGKVVQIERLEKVRCQTVNTVHSG